MTVSANLTGLPVLSDDRTIDGIAIRSEVFDPLGDDVATSQLAIDRKVEQGKVAGPSFDQEPASDRPDLVWPRWRLAPISLPLFQGVRRRWWRGCLRQACSYSLVSKGIEHARWHRLCLLSETCGRGGAVGWVPRG